MEPLKRVSPPPEHEAARQRCSVLVVDDNRGDLRLAQEAIRGEEFDVAMVSSGADALRAIELHVPDVVLLDLILPDMDGGEVLQRIRESEPGRDLPVIILTGKSDVDDVVAGLSLGATDYVTKPYHPAIVRARIRLHHAAKQGRDELRRINRLKDEFLSVASHDLQNPVSTIIGYAGWLLEGRAGDLLEPHRDSVMRIYKNATFMRELIADLLDLLKIEAGRMTLYPERMDVGEIVREAIERNTFAAADKDIGLRSNVDPRVPSLVADPLKIQQLLNNLISNGIKFSNPGAQVEVHVKRALGGVQMAVSDTGQGIPEAERDKLFRKWGQLSVRATRGEKSTGLGLMIAKKIVDLHGGRIWVESEVGKGSTFHVFLPLTPAAPVAP
jgi:signal transduction histidine kinase